MSNEMNQQPRKRGPMGRMGRGMQPGEKPKDLKKSIKQLAQYIGKYKIAIFIVMICAACSTVFNVAGPKILGKATTALSEGLMEKIRGTGSIDFARIGTILLFVLGLYLMSALFSFIQGWIMTGVTQKVCYQLRKEISEKINRMPMKYFESRTHHKRCRYAWPGTEPEYHDDHHLGGNAGRRSDHDAEYLSADDADRTCDPANFYGADRTGDEEIPEILP